MDKTAVVIIDMQDEFFSPHGVLRNRFLDPLRIVPNISQVTDICRQLGAKIVWIKSVYGVEIQKPEPKCISSDPNNEKHIGVPINDDRLSTTHFGNRPCCLKDSPLTKFCGLIEKDVKPEDKIIIKTRYSAYIDTELDTYLKENYITDVIYGGVVTNVCVQATACDGFFLGYNQTIIKDCTLASSDDRYDGALEYISKYYARIVRTNDLFKKIENEYVHSPLVANILFKGHNVIRGLGDGDSMLIMDILPPDIASTIFEIVKNKTEWNVMMHRGGPVPRLVSMQGELSNGNEPIYRHPADEQPAFIEYTPTSDMLRKIVEKLIEQPLNHALIQYYYDGESYISEHSDKTLDVKKGTNILNLSLGATRTMILRPKSKEGTNQKIRLPHNSLFVMGWNTNRRWLHSIKQDKRPKSDKDIDETSFNGERVSYTFRTISTFSTPDGKLFGQGAVCKSIDGMNDVQNIQNTVDDSLDMLKAFSIENHNPNFDWDMYYGKGFNSINFKTLKDKNIESVKL